MSSSEIEASGEIYVEPDLGLNVGLTEVHPDDGIRAVLEAAERAGAEELAIGVGEFVSDPEIPRPPKRDLLADAVAMVRERQDARGANDTGVTVESPTFDWLDPAEPNRFDASGTGATEEEYQRNQRLIAVQQAAEVLKGVVGGRSGAAIGNVARSANTPRIKAKQITWLAAWIYSGETPYEEEMGDLSA